MSSLAPHSGHTSRTSYPHLNARFLVHTASATTETRVPFSPAVKPLLRSVVVTMSVHTLLPSKYAPLAFHVRATLRSVTRCVASRIITFNNARLKVMSGTVSPRSFRQAKASTASRPILSTVKTIAPTRPRHADQFLLQAPPVPSFKSRF